jgi:hypothetical protein
MTTATLVAVETQLARWDGYVEEPPGSNSTIFNRWYWGSDVHAAWCAAYQSYAFHHAGYTDIPKFAYTPDGAAFCTRKGWKVGRSTPIQRGDWVFYYWRDMGRIAHIGWVQRVLSDGTYYAWEGNTDVAGGRTGGRVILHHRSRSTVNESLGGMFARIPYRSPAPTPAPIPVEFEEDEMDNMEIPGDGVMHAMGTADPNGGAYNYKRVFFSLCSDSEIKPPGVRVAYFKDGVVFKIYEGPTAIKPYGRNWGEFLPDGVTCVSVGHNGPGFVTACIEIEKH